LQREFELELEQIDVLAKYLKDILTDDCIVILRGDLASGKTTLVKNYLKVLDLTDLVTSPTFSLQAIYSNDIFHYDVYNKTLSEFISLGMQPILIHVPPCILSERSTMATFHPRFANSAARVFPPLPKPIIITSNVFISI
jgi:tRNA threonylcarbamoyl adenosine modification protein YjeE